MTQNVFMHPRNDFKIPPNYTDLAIKHADFRKVCILNLEGTVRLDMRSPKTLQVLSKTLLREFFELEVDFAPGSLIPTIPSRLNYLLWIEDLSKSLNWKEISGIDIGCGSSCIYSLLAAKKFKWNMLALEIDQGNFSFAKRNVENNMLNENIEVFLQSDKNVIFKEYFEKKPSKKFKFCMCNPPYFENIGRLPMNRKRRREAKNEPTGNLNELAFQGGEVEFIKKIINESCEFKDHIEIFTSLIGVKKNITSLEEFLKSKDITNFVITSFCQGNTTRWGIAWTFNNYLKLNIRNDEII
uniref:U6 snRNA m(6)A methyltransferase n=1 Tax=Megaselia scalaris TaxID=36166 RepID=T1GB02_MEGSC